MIIYVMPHILKFADMQRKQSSLGFVNKLLVKICMCAGLWRQVFFFILFLVPALIFL